MPTVHADPPTLDVVYPAGAARGSTNTITLSGKLEPWPPNVWISSPQRSSNQSRSGPVTAATDIIVSAETNKGKLTLVVSPDAEPGPRIVRLFNEDGASDTRFFVVGAGREITEAETNNHFAVPQPIETLPVTINGRLTKGGDVDSFGISLRDGEILEARVESYTLMSKLDGVLRLVTTNGQQLAWNHDFASLDPHLTWRASGDQNVVLQIFGFPHPATADIRLYGSDSAFYRLDVSASPPALAPAPALAPTLPLPLPTTLRGCIVSNTEEDRFTFIAAKDDFIEARITAAALGSPLDAWLAVLDPTGKEVSRRDDNDNSRDPVIEWKAPTNGVYTVVVGSLTHRGSDEHRYELGIKRVAADFRASLSASSLTITAGSTNSLKFKVKRLRDHTNDLTATIAGLPLGVTAGSTNLAAKTGDFEISLIAATNAPAYSGPVHLYLTDATTREDRLALFPLTSRTEDNGVPGGYTDLVIDTLDHCWLTVRKKPDEAPKTAAAKSP
jgi:hypothetical protein